ncbi:hypothetical protein OHB26_16230 [Nocardia sp. NBC_01503]|uniref:hypothetical protein n=1 Tax=Nocardia sp. NBC_01503 TaxID=2975997 RepID=UPI002E7BA285|nr:hypothetical protein [Nocardia sp. NBC_01503]WTL35598.1 hypothetical protein OHB26_16230 [Nocardia sp. NBC_01503]
MPVFARSTVGIAAVAAMGVATIVSATTASADMSIRSSSAYCVGSTYTVTLPASDAAVLIGNVPLDTEFVFRTSAVGGSTFTTFTTVPYVAGKDVVASWTPTAPGQVMVSAWPNNTTTGPAYFGENGPTVNVVQTAPSGTTCGAATGGTGSANSIPVIGGLLSGLSAQK